MQIVTAALFPVCAVTALQSVHALVLAHVNETPGSGD